VTAKLDTTKPSTTETVKEFNWDGIRRVIQEHLDDDPLSVLWSIGDDDKSLRCKVRSDELTDTKPAMWRATEFGHELIGLIPWHFALCKKQRVSLRTHSVEGMEPYYFWSPHHDTERGAVRSSFGLPRPNPMDRSTVHMPLVKTPWTQFPDSAHWLPPNFKARFSNKVMVFNNDKRTVLISNKFNDEFGLGHPVNFFNASTLSSLFDAYLLREYNVIYKRPRSQQLLRDVTAQRDSLGDHELIRSRYKGQVLRYTDIVHFVGSTMGVTLNGTGMNLVQLQVMANVEEFVSIQGGAAALAAMFCRKHTILHREGLEYLKGDYSYYFKLNSNNHCDSRVYRDEKLMLQDLSRKTKHKHSGKPCLGCVPGGCHCEYIDPAYKDILKEWL